MAPRVSDVPPDEEWPDLEEHEYPPDFPLGGAYARCLEYLHGARLTLDAGLLAPTRALTASAARVALRVAEDEDDVLDDEERLLIERAAEGRVPPDADELIDVLGGLAAFVERRAHAREA